jgi:copper chaperone CopZ
MTVRLTPDGIVFFLHSMLKRKVMKMSHQFLAISLTFIAAIFFLPAQGQAQSTQTVSFKVFGTCGECKERIETTAMDVKGVKKAEWDVQSDMLVLVGSRKMDKMKVAQALAKAGHKSDLVPADPAGYAALPECCKYEHTEKH